MDFAKLMADAEKKFNDCKLKKDQAEAAVKEFEIEMARLQGEHRVLKSLQDSAKKAE